MQVLKKAFQEELFCSSAKHLSTKTSYFGAVQDSSRYLWTQKSQKTPESSMSTCLLPSFMQKLTSVFDSHRVSAIDIKKFERSSLVNSYYLFIYNIVLVKRSVGKFWKFLVLLLSLQHLKFNQTSLQLVSRPVKQVPWLKGLGVGVAKSLWFHISVE